MEPISEYSGIAKAHLLGEPRAQSDQGLITDTTKLSGRRYLFATALT